MKGVSCVTQLSSLKPVTNVKNVASNLPVGARLKHFWQTWLDLGASPKVVQILREGYILPFQIRPNLTRSPTVISCYGNPHRNLSLLEALHQLIDKKRSRVGSKSKISGVFYRLFLVPKPNNKWRPILDLSKINPFLRVQKFKMETPETIRTSLQQGEWVTSIDFKDAYFHIPIQEQSRKYQRFHVEGRTYQFKALPFGLSTASLKFTMVAKEVKMMAMRKGIRIHQYLDDWLVRASSHQICLRHTRDLVRICKKTRLAGERREIGAGAQAGLQFCRLPVQSKSRSGQTDTGPMAEPTGQNTRNTVSAYLSSPADHVSDRVVNSHREASSPRPTTYETHTVASQKQLEGTRITGKDDPNSQVPASPFTMVARKRQYPNRPTVTPNKTCSNNLYRCIKRMVGRSLKRAYCKRNLVPSRKQAAYQ